MSVKEEKALTTVRLKRVIYFLCVKLSDKSRRGFFFQDLSQNVNAFHAHKSIF